MSFTLVGPFSFGSKVTSAQFNQLDTDHANALDKSVAGDAIAGTITFTGAGTITANVAGAITSSHAGGISSGILDGIRTSTLGGIQSNIAKGIRGTVTDAIAPSVAKGISDGGIIGGIGPTIAGGITDGGVAQGIEATVADGISSTIASGIQSDVAGGFAYNGGILDYHTYVQTRSIAVFQPPIVHALSSGWTLTGTNFVVLTGPGTTTTQVIPIVRPFNGILNGAKLTSVTMFMDVGSTHSAVPNPLPTMAVRRVLLTPGFTPAVADLFSGGTVTFPTPTPNTGVGWYSSGQIQTLTLFCDQNNGIGESATSAANYYIVLNDESGGNAIAGNQYWGFVFTYTNLQNNADG